MVQAPKLDKATVPALRMTFVSALGEPVGFAPRRRLSGSHTNREEPPAAGPSDRKALAEAELGWGHHQVAH